MLGRYLYIISFTVRKDSGLAIVAASSEREAKTILTTSGRYGRSIIKYNVIEIKCLGETCSCDYGLVMESYTNAEVAYAALVSVMDKIKGEKGDKGDKGDKGEKGDTGDMGSVTAEGIEEALGYVPAKISTNTVAGWAAATGYVPESGEIVIYVDRETVTIEGRTVYVPGVKIGSGNAYVQDLAFADEKLSQTVMAHINNGDIHVTVEDKAFWDNKLNVTDTQETVGETLVFNRN